MSTRWLTSIDELSVFEEKGAPAHVRSAALALRVLQKLVLQDWFGTTIRSSDALIFQGTNDDEYYKNRCLRIDDLEHVEPICRVIVATIRSRQVASRVSCDLSWIQAGAFPLSIPVQRPYIFPSW